MKETTMTGACEAARAKFEKATAFLRDRAEMMTTPRAEGDSVIVKSHLKAISKPFTQADVLQLRKALSRNGFDEIRIPELTGPSPTLICIATFHPTNTGVTVADLVAFVTRHKKIFPNGLNTRIVVGDFEGNETHHALELSEETSHLKILS